MSEVEIAISKAKELIEGKKENKGFGSYAPLYPFNTENSSKVFYSRYELINNNDVVTVTGSGDAILDLIFYGANKIHAFDINILTKYYTELKIAAVKALSCDEYKQLLLCSYHGAINNQLYNKVKDFLDGDFKIFWDEIFSFIDEKKLNMYPSFEGNTEAKLFYSIQSIFGSANKTFNNRCSYMATEDSFEKLKKIILTKNKNDITFHNTSLFDLGNKVDFTGISYFYFSNIMDFFIGLNKGIVSKKGLIEFKSRIFKILNKTPKNSTVDVSILKDEGYLYKNELQDYYDTYDLAEGFEIEKLGDKVMVLSFSKEKIMNLDNDVAPKNK